ncbi:cytochrome P460 family protein [Pelagerythrobacter aerophilus]
MPKGWIAIFASSALAAGTAGCSKPLPQVGAQTESPSGTAAAVPDRYLPEYAEDGSLKLPKNWRTWVYLGSPFTPNALNNGEASFPEFHNVYIEPVSYAIYKETGEFPEGTIFFKELQLALPGEYPDGSRIEPSGRGYFPGAYNGADVAVKDSKKYASTDGWGYYNFNHHEPKAATATPRPREECASCHIAGAKKDDVWTQFYPLLDDLSLD